MRGKNVLSKGTCVTRRLGAWCESHIYILLLVLLYLPIYAMHTLDGGDGNEWLIALAFLEMRMKFMVSSVEEAFCSGESILMFQIQWEQLNKQMRSFLDSRSFMHVLI